MITTEALDDLARLFDEYEELIDEVQAREGASNWLAPEAAPETEPWIGKKTRHPEYENRIGVIIEHDKALARVRVKWEDKRTWIAIKRLKLV